MGVIRLGDSFNNKKIEVMLKRLNKEIFFVCGMHRSGTSILTKLIEIFDINIGTDFSPTRADNPTGFYEDMSFYRVNRKLYEINNISWNEIINPINLKLKTETSDNRFF